MSQQKASATYNVVVIGAGTAGLVTAAGTAGLGGRVALIERNRMGGDCLNFGCVPSKALISSARLLHRMKRAAAWGVEPPAVTVDLQRIFERMRECRAQMEPHDSQERFESLGVDVFRGAARFLSPEAVEVDGLRLRARHFVIATGSRAAIPPIEGLESISYFMNETIFDRLERMPRRMLIIGGGPIGCELGQAFGRFGVQVSIVQRQRLLPQEDPDISEAIRAVLAGEGLKVLEQAAVTRVQPGNAGTFVASIQEHGDLREEEFDTLLIAAGRTPNIETLQLDGAGVETGKRGVAVNHYLQTSQSHIYAAGDVTGRHLFTHMADYQARIVVRNILMPFQFLRQRADSSVVPWCTFTDPEVARVGLNEIEAKKQGIAYDLFEQPMESVDRAILERASMGRAKVLLRRGTDRILGAAIVSEHAGELLQPFVLAMRAGVGLRTLGSAIHPYPTFVEVGRKIADQYQRGRLTPLAKRVFGALYRRQRGPE